MPKVTVLMPVYNSENYLKESIEGVLNQTFKDFEFLIINDGSTDRSVEIIQSYDDDRIRFINNQDNKFYMKRLNEGIEIAQGKYIARMDSDDICLPERLQKQVEVLDKNPDVGIVGTFWQMFGSRDNLVEVPQNHDDIKVFSIFHSPFGHPTVMFRKSMFNEFSLRYSEDFPFAEDYELWTRALKYFKGANINEVLLNYRVHCMGVTSSRSEVQHDTARRVRKRILEKLDLFSEENLNLHTEFSRSYNLGQISTDTKKGLNWLEKIYTANKEKKIYNQESMQKFFEYIGYFVAYNAHYDGLKVFFEYKKSRFANKEGKKRLFEACFRAERKKLKRIIFFKN